jgi:hypothetical protein
MAVIRCATTPIHETGCQSQFQGAARNQRTAKALSFARTRKESTAEASRRDSIKSLLRTPCAVTRKEFTAQALSFAVTRNDCGAPEIDWLCNRCGVSLAHPIIEKDAVEFIIRCETCNTSNVLKLSVLNRFLAPTVEITGWKE